jgi:hypothetical protein
VDSKPNLRCPHSSVPHPPRVFDDMWRTIASGARGGKTTGASWGAVKRQELHKRLRLERRERVFLCIASSLRSMPGALRQILETRDCVIGDRCAKRKCNSSELVRLLHGQISCGDQEEICVAASLFGSLVLESSRAVLDGDQIRVFELLEDCVMHSSSIAVACACLRAMSNCFAARKPSSQLNHLMCSRVISFVLHPGTAFNSPQEPSAVDLPSEQLRQDLQVCACRLLSASATFLQFCSEPDAKAPSLKPSFKAAVLSSGPSFDAQIYSENCMKVAHLAFAAGTTVRLTAAILDALASSPRPLFIFGLLQLKQQQCVDLLHTGHPSVRAALSRLLIVSLSTSAAPPISLNGLGPSDASRALCRLLGMNETAKQAVQVIASLLSPRPSQPLLIFFLSQRLIHAMCKLMVTLNLNSGLLETLFDCMAKLTSSFEEARRVVVDFCEEQAATKQVVLITVALGHINSSSSRLRHSSAHFLLTMSRSPLAIRSVFVDACVAPVLLSLLSSSYFDEALQPDVSVAEVVFVQNSTSRHCSADEFSYSAIVVAIISNCLLPLSLFRDELIFSGTLVPLLCRCAIDSKDRELRSNSLCAIASIMASQTSQELKLGILTQLDVTQLLRILECGSALEQELCMLILRNCADGPAEEIGAFLMLFRLHESSVSLFVRHFSDFCFGEGEISAHVPESAPHLESTRAVLTKLHYCAFHDCPTDELGGASTRCLGNCAQIRCCIASIVSFCVISTSSPATVEQLLLLLANIASGSSGRKALVLDALQPSFMAEALASDEDAVRRVSLARCCVSFALSHAFAGGSLAFTHFEFKVGTIGNAPAARCLYERARFL